LVAMVETTTEETTESAGASVTAEEFEANVAQYVGQTVNLSGLRVAGRVGEQAFWVELPSGSPYLVKMSDALVAEGFAVQSGDPVDVLGRVHQMTDSVVAAWEASGAIQGEGQKAEVLLATTFLEAIRARVGGSTPASEGRIAGRGPGFRHGVRAGAGARANWRSKRDGRHGSHVLCLREGSRRGQQRESREQQDPSAVVA